MALTEQMLPDEADEQAPLARRIGRFGVHASMLRHAKEPVLYAVFAGVIPVKTEQNWVKDHVEYLALCADFDPIALGDEPPWYQLEISHVEGDITVRRFQRVDRPLGLVTTVGVGERLPTGREVRDYVVKTMQQVYNTSEQNRVMAAENLKRQLENLRGHMPYLSDPNIRSSIDAVSDAVRSYAAEQSLMRPLYHIPEPEWDRQSPFGTLDYEKIKQQIFSVQAAQAALGPTGQFNAARQTPAGWYSPAANNVAVVGKNTP